MNYRSSQADGFDFTDSRIVCGETAGADLILYIEGAYSLGTAPENPSGKDTAVSEMKMTLTGFELSSAEAVGRRILNIKNDSVRDSKDRRLYKSELADLTDRLCREGADIFALSAGSRSVGMEVNFDSAAGEESLFTVKISCDEIIMEWDSFGEVRVRKKLTLKERADMLRTDIPAVFLALGKKETPGIAKIMAALAVGYALSPIDLVPDFIPVFGYLDDILILPGLIYMSVRLIPEDVMAQCRKEAAGLWTGGRPKKWFYALPVIIIWMLVMMGIISAFL